MQEAIKELIERMISDLDIREELQDKFRDVCTKTMQSPCGLCQKHPPSALATVALDKETLDTMPGEGPRSVLIGLCALCSTKAASDKTFGATVNSLIKKHFTKMN